MYTSCFSNVNVLLDHGYTNLVSIAGISPKYFDISKNSCFSEYKKLAPKYWWWKKWKDENLDDNYYIKMYYKTVLNNLDPHKVYSELGVNAVLLCYEKQNVFCHRYIVADWFFKTIGVKITELSL